jgi:hypothetical protein
VILLGTVAKQLVDRIVDVASDSAAPSSPGMSIKVLMTKAELKRRAARFNPFGRMAMIKTNRDTYEARKATWFKKQAAKWIPHLVAWDVATRLIAAVGRVKLKFMPGFILDSGVRAEAYTTGDVGAGQQRFLLVMPDFLEAQVKANRKDPRAIAAYLHRIACHELAHLPHMGERHSDDWAVTYEDLAVATQHVMPTIEKTVIDVFKIDVPVPPELRTAEKKRADAEARAEKYRLELAEARKLLTAQKDHVENDRALRMELERTQTELATVNSVLFSANARLGAANAEIAALRAVASQSQPGAGLEEVADLLNSLRALESYHAFRRMLEGDDPVVARALPPVDRRAVLGALLANPEETLAVFRELRR